MNLFLLALLRVGLGLGSLLPDTDESGLGSGDSQLAVSTTLLALGQVALLDLLETVLDADAGVDGQDGRELAYNILGVGCGLDVLSAAVQLLVLSGLAWEQDQASLVGLETVDIQA